MAWAGREAVDVNSLQLWNDLGCCLELACKSNEIVVKKEHGTLWQPLQGSSSLEETVLGLRLFDAFRNDRQYMDEKVKQSWLW